MYRLLIKIRGILVKILSFIQWIRSVLYQILSIILSYIPSRESKKYDLVLMRVDAIGDYIIWHDSLSAYEKKFKGAKVLFICADIVKPLAENEKFFTDIISINRNKCWSNVIYLIRLLRKLKSISSDTSIYPSWERHVRGDALFRQINSSLKIGMKSKSKRGISDLLFDGQYSQLVYYNDSESEIKAVEYFTKAVISPEYKYGLNPIRPLKGQIKDLPDYYIIVAFSAAIKERSWELGKFSTVIDSIPQKYGIVLTGAGNVDKENAAQIIDKVQNKDRIINLVNKINVCELVNVVSGAAFLIGNDSAPIHMAAATRVKSICICPGGHYGRFLPYPNDILCADYNPIVVSNKMNCFGCGHKCIYDDKIPFYCLKTIDTQHVITKLKPLYI